MPKDYYKLLGVPKGATQDEIKKAFKKLALQFHPDRPGGDEKKFKEINEAYQVLGDAEKRARYDQFGADFDQQGGFGAGMNWEDFMRSARGGGGMNFDFGGMDFGDIFGDLFGGRSGSARRGRAQTRRGRDIQVDVELDFKEAAFGAERNLSLRKQAKCDVCAGSGSEPGSKMEKCGACGGQGQVVQTQRTFLGAMQTVATCSDCHGRGEKPGKKCKHCGGDGVLSKTVDIKVKIPAGIDDGQSIRLAGYGEAAPHGGESGDLYVQAHVRPNSYFHREGFDVYTDLEINFAQAALGDNAEIETLDGKLKIVVPEGVESGQLIRLKGHGIEKLGLVPQRGPFGSRGDQYVRVKIKVPKKVSRDLRKKLEDLREYL